MAQQPARNPDDSFCPIGDIVEGSQPLTLPSCHQAGGHGKTEGLLTGSELVQEVESLCMRCGKTGVTRLLLTSIPYFLQVIVSSFCCLHCGERNNEVQPAGEVQPKGMTYTVHLTRASDLDRQVVRSSTATLNVPELELEIPPQRGQLTTIEGILSNTVQDLEFDQPLRQQVAPPAYEKIREICQRIKDVLSAGSEPKRHVDVLSDGSGLGLPPSTIGARSNPPHTGATTSQSRSTDPHRVFLPLTFRLDDPAGNSFIEFLGPAEGLGASDAKWVKRDYARSPAQNAALGVATPSDVDVSVKAEAERTVRTTNAAEGGEHRAAANQDQDQDHEIYSFPGTCSSCSAPVATMMHKLTIPYFQDVIIMSTKCERCGYRDNEVKAGGAVSATARRLTLKVEEEDDLSRDVLKSDTAALEVPEIELRLAPGTLGGRFTTLEGLLQQVYDELSEKVMNAGDSSASRGVNTELLETFLGRLKGLISVDQPYTVILDDALANSYIQSPYAPDPDPQLLVQDYERTWEQREDLGLNDMNVEPSKYRAQGHDGDGSGEEKGYHQAGPFDGEGAGGVRQTGSKGKAEEQLVEEMTKRPRVDR